MRFHPFPEISDVLEILNSRALVVTSSSNLPDCYIVHYMSHPLYLIATIYPKQGKTDEAKDAFEELIEATRQEAGCELYDLVHSAGESVWVMMEKWSSKSAWDAHMQTSHVKRINEIGPNFLEKPSELKILNPL